MPRAIDVVFDALDIVPDKVTDIDVVSDKMTDAEPSNDEKPAEELMSAYNREGEAVAKRDDAW